ncbi:MAG: TetR/AcrR family transcriptional regulator [Rudaea sp.]
MGAKRAVAAEKHETAEVASKPRVRDRIFETACNLFYQHGIRAVGVDAIAQGAGTNKMSFYRSFPSKEDLVAEYLREQQRGYFEWWDSTIAPYAGNPLKQLHALFDSYLGMSCSSAAEDAECRTSRGCALGNAAVEIPQDNEMLAGIVHDYKSEIRRRLRKLARDAGAREANSLGDALMLLMEGGYYTRLTYEHNSGPVAAIAKAARALIESHMA